MDHDQRFKVLIQEFLKEFLQLFYPDLLPCLDLENVTWLHQEIYHLAREGETQSIDLLVQIPLLAAAASLEPEATNFDLILLHIEIESADSVEPFRRRMYLYFNHLTEKHGLRVLPLAVYLRVGLEGQGKDAYQVKVLNRTPLRFEYDYVGLPGLQGERYLDQDNPLGIAWSALMRWRRAQRPQAAVEALERIVASPESPARKLLLCECIQAYAPLEEDQRIELYSLLKQPEHQGVRTMVKTWTEEAREEVWRRACWQGSVKCCSSNWS